MYPWSAKRTPRTVGFSVTAPAHGFRLLDRAFRAVAPLVTARVRDNSEPRSPVAVFPLWNLQLNVWVKRGPVVLAGSFLNSLYLCDFGNF